jgi:hypothetical protein
LFLFRLKLYLKLYIILSRVLPRRRLGNGIGWIFYLHRRHLIVGAARVWVCGRPPFAVGWQSQSGRVGVLDLSLRLVLVDWRRWRRFWVACARHKHALRGNKQVLVNNFYSEKKLFTFTFPIHWKFLSFLSRKLLIAGVESPLHLMATC